MTKEFSFLSATKKLGWKTYSAILALVVFSSKCVELPCRMLLLQSYSFSPAQKFANPEDKLYNNKTFIAMGFRKVSLLSQVTKMTSDINWDPCKGLHLPSWMWCKYTVVTIIFPPFGFIAAFSIFHNLFHILRTALGSSNYNILWFDRFVCRSFHMFSVWLLSCRWTFPHFWNYIYLYFIFHTACTVSHCNCISQAICNTTKWLESLSIFIIQLLYWLCTSPSDL